MKWFFAAGPDLYGRKPHFQFLWVLRAYGTLVESQIKGIKRLSGYRL